jgi:5-methylcytosine-specific restriction enzyme A
MGETVCLRTVCRPSIVVKQMSLGDVVLLVESARIDGVVSRCARLEFSIVQKFRKLSAALWGDDKYLYIFFFRTEPLFLPWIEFLDQCGFKESCNPAGKVYSIARLRLSKYGGVEAYVAFLPKSYSTR